MGRGRQKAKHTKIARALKSYSPDVNYGALERELTHKDPDSQEYVDRWAEYAGADEQDDADESDYAEDEAKGA